MVTRLLGALVLLAVLAVAAPGAAAAAVPANVKRVLADYRSDGRIDPCEHSAKDLRDTLEAASADTEQYAADLPSAVEAALEARSRADCADKEDSGDSDDDTGDSDGAGGGGTGAGGGTATPTPSPSATPSPTSTPAAPSRSRSDAPAAGVPGPRPSPSPGPSPAPSQEVAPGAPGPGAGVTPGVPPAQTNRPDVALTRRAAQTGPAETPAPVIVMGALLLACLLGGLALLAMRRFGWGEERFAGARHAFGEAGYRAGGTWHDFTDWVRLGR
jgi:hypothetical protein